MTAPDPGLTDLIAEHLTELIADAPEEDNYDAGYVAALADLRDSAAFTLVVEQHTNGRIAALEADSANWKDRYDDAKQVIESATVTWTATIRDRNEWRERALTAEAAIAGVEKLAHDMRG